MNTTELDHGAALRANLVTHGAKQFALGSEVTVIDKGVIAAGQKGKIVAFHPHMQKYEISFDEQWSGWYPADSLKSVQMKQEEPLPIKETKSSSDGPTPERYKWQWQGVGFDFYRLCGIVGVTHPAQAHAMKKVIRAGKSVKPIERDIDEAIDALLRWKEMLNEDGIKEIEPEPEPEPELESFYGFIIGQKLVNKFTGKTGIVHKFRVKDNDIVLNSDGVLSPYFVWTLQQHWEQAEQDPGKWYGVTVGQKLVNKHTGKTATVQKIRDDDTVVLSHDDQLAIHQSSLYSMDDIKTHWVALKS